MKRLSFVTGIKVYYVLYNTTIQHLILLFNNIQELVRARKDGFDLIKSLLFLRKSILFLRFV